jgi:1-aminocyclopropane-1-carboxylate synthase
MDDETLEVALKRINAFVGEQKERDALSTKTKDMPSKTKCWKKNLRLSFSSRIFEEGIGSPIAMSPHSPLVLART